MKHRHLPVLILFVLAITYTTASAQYEKGKFGIGLYASHIKLLGGSKDDCILNYASGISLRYTFSSHLTSEITAGLGWLRPRDPDSYFAVRANTPYRTYIRPLSVNLRYHFLAKARFTPFFELGAGMINWNLRDISGGDSWFPIPESGESVHGNMMNISGWVSLGFTCFLSENLALDVQAKYGHMLDQTLDNIGTGDINTGLGEIRIGLNIFFGGKKDSDNDGIIDKFDGAPFEPEDMDGFLDEDGIPDLDNDNDGIPDVLDGAPNLPEDIDGFQDEDGIPDLDNDNDGIPDALDGAPNDPEDMDGFQDKDGIPDLDNDGDGILDIYDAAPNQPETFNGYQDEDGAPDVKPVPVLMREGESIVYDGVTFQLGKTNLTENARIILNRVAESLSSHEEIRLEIRGFTDNTGGAAFNLGISQKRAEVVRNYLINQGITQNRLTAIGYGEASPIASNSTKAGRNKNRRIEFIRLEK